MQFHNTMTFQYPVERGKHGTELIKMFIYVTMLVRKCQLSGYVISNPMGYRPRLT